MHDRGAERQAPAVQARIELELGHVRAAYEAVLAAVPRLLRWLAEGDEETRDAAAGVLSRCHGRAAEVGPVLELACERDESSMVRASSLLAMEALAYPCDQRAVSWLDGSVPVQRTIAAMVHLRAGGSDPRALKAIEDAAPAAIAELKRLSLGDGDPLDFVLDALADDWRVQANVLQRWLNSPDRDVRRGAAFSVERLVETWRAAPALLTDALMAAADDEDARVRWWATRSLVGCAFAVDRAIEALRSIALDGVLEHNTPSAIALQGLVQLGDEPALRRVLDGLVAGDSTERAGCRRLLQFLDPDAPGVFEQVRAIVSELPPGNLRIHAIGKLGRASAVPILRGELPNHPHQTTRVLGDIGPDAASALSDLRAMTEHDEPVVRFNVARALWTIGGDSAGVETLCAAACGSDPAGATALSWLAPLAKTGAPVHVPLARLCEFMAGRDVWARAYAAQVHWALAHDAEAVLPTLLEDLDGTARGRLALDTIGEMGPAALAAASRLKEMIDSERRVGTHYSGNGVEADVTWTRLCTDALSKIAPDS